ncbi:MAG: hypothetical protein KDD47_28715, partial [Acidobacteria bacterium]|nr:hypothetical protein [Acidobacteriota bacterium]
AQESVSAYQLCYTCHLRGQVLEASAFPQHGRHVVDLRASCATCHNPHGSVDNRALIRFSEETVLGAVAPSASTGRLAFVSSAPGSGACYLTCHGVDHGPATYGGLEMPETFSVSGGSSVLGTSRSVPWAQDSSAASQDASAGALPIPKKIRRNP